MMIKNKIIRVIIILGLLLVALISLWLFLFVLVKRDRQVIKEGREKAQQLTRGGDISFSLNREKVDKLSKYFLTDKEIVIFVEELEKIGQQTGIKLTLGQADNKATELKLNLSMAGTFSQTMKFLQSLENLPYASQVERLELRERGGQWQSIFILRILKSKDNV